MYGYIVRKVCGRTTEISDTCWKDENNANKQLTDWVKEEVNRHEDDGVVNTTISEDYGYAKVVVNGRKKAEFFIDKIEIV